MPGLEPLPLAHLPTPLESLPSLSRRLRIPILIKRDDCTGLATGGNKARKLSWIVADARREGADTLITFGGIQSNHARDTAAAAARYGLGCTLLLGGPEPARPEGNLLLDRLFGAEIVYLGLTPSTLTAGAVRKAFRDAEGRLRAIGKRTRLIPAGASEPLGVAAFAVAFQELLLQAHEMGEKLESIVVSVGTGGTFAGLVLGNLLASRPVRVIGISSAPPGMPETVGVAPLEELVRGGAEALTAVLSREGTGEGRFAPTRSDLVAALSGLRREDLEIDYGWAGRAYGATTGDSIEAIRMLAREEGILLDPVYTCKAMAGLVAKAERGEIGREGSVVFWHTGGIPALFPYGESLVPGRGGPS